MAHVEFAVSHLTIDSEIAFVAGGQGFRNVEVKQSRAACAVSGVRRSVRQVMGGQGLSGATCRFLRETIDSVDSNYYLKKRDAMHTSDSRQAPLAVSLTVDCCLGSSGSTPKSLRLLKFAHSAGLGQTIRFLTRCKSRVVGRLAQIPVHDAVTPHLILRRLHEHASSIPARRHHPSSAPDACRLGPATRRTS